MNIFRVKNQICMIRNIMNRFSFNEITTNRMIHACLRRIKDIPDRFLWSDIFSNARENKNRLNEYKNIHQGKRCFVIGNGPSLGKMDLNKINNEVTFGANRIYILSDEFPFIPTYYVAINDLIINQYRTDINKLSIPKFLNWKYRRYIRSTSSLFLKIKFNIVDIFSKDLLKPISSGGTVTFVSLQIAFWMGFSEVILIGVDHDFKTKGTPNLTEKRKQEKDEDHFNPEYFPKGSKWQLPDLKRSELSYKLALDAFTEDGRMIKDATIDGKCPIFPKVEYESLF